MDQLRCLRVFVQVVADGSFAAAARRLDLAPAVATRALAELEAHLGTRLLHRTTRRLALTDIGETYLETARSVLAQLDEGDPLAGAATRQPGGTLKVACPPAFAVHQLARVLPLFTHTYPRIVVDLAVPGPLAVVDDAADLSILSVGGQAPQGDFVARPLARSTFLLCASPAYLRQRGVPHKPQDLVNHLGVAPAVAGQRREIMLHWCGAGPPPEGVGRWRLMWRQRRSPPATLTPCWPWGWQAQAWWACPALSPAMPCKRAICSRYYRSGAARFCTCTPPCQRASMCPRARACFWTFWWISLAAWSATRGWRAWRPPWRRAR